MSLDALCLSGLANELRAGLTGAKIDKIYQPGRDDIILVLRCPSGNRHLLLSANPNHPRPQFTELNHENPEKPPMFCLLLRKHLTGGRIISVIQPHLERILIIHLEAPDELGDRREFSLVLELIGHHTNLILVDGEGRITSCIRHTDSDVSSRRQLLPGMFYRLPPSPKKKDPSVSDGAELLSLLRQAQPDCQADRWLLETFSGLSPLICRELVHRISGATDTRLSDLGQDGCSRLLHELETLFSSVKSKSFTPSLISIDGRPYDYSFLPISQYGNAAEVTTYSTFSEMLDLFYEQRDQLEQVRQRGQDLIRTVTAARDRVARRIAAQNRELKATYDRDRLRMRGDIITSNLYRMHQGMEHLCTENFYSPEPQKIIIPLDPLLTPQQNAAKYYRNYTKAKKAEEALTIQLEKGNQELSYLNSVLENISLAEGEHDFDEIRQELIATGYIRTQQKSRPAKHRALSKPMEFRSSSGLRISVGKNNLQNDLLTCKKAYKSDLWFHAQKIHGSHTILWTEGQEPDLQSIQEAACLAAWFSQGRDSDKVPVDYTRVKFVKKPAGAQPGMVIYTDYQTILVRPKQELVKSLRNK